MTSLYDAALIAFVDEYLEDHPDADEFDAERAFEALEDDLIVVICAAAVGRAWKEKDSSHENI